MKSPSRAASLALVFLAASCAPSPAASRQASGPAHERQAGFKAVTYNLRTSDADGSDRARGNHWDARKEALLAQLKDTRASLIGLQELSARQAADVEARFKATHRLLTGPRELGLLVDRSFFVVSGSGSVKLTGSDQWGDRYLLWARLGLKDGCGCVLAVDAHFSTEEASRRSNVRTLSDWLARQEGGCAPLVMGDLNEPEGPATDPIRAVVGDGQAWVAAAPGVGTFNDFAAAPGGRLDASLKLDHILARVPQLRIVSSKVHSSHPGRNAYSDHYALEAVLALTAPDCRRPARKK